MAERELSGSQKWALDLLRQQGPMTRKQWRNAGITTNTMRSLQRAGLVTWQERDGITVWQATPGTEALAGTGGA